MDNLLDNPAWSALTTTQASFALGNDNAKRYKPDVLPFAAVENAHPEKAATTLDALIAPGETIYLIGELPALKSNWKLEVELPCAQLMAPENLHCLPQPQETILKLGDTDKDEMFGLITSLQPGYYRRNTPQLGEYYGIRRGGRLIAMAGERMRISGFSELSAICTHPDHTGHGYAQQLIAWLCRRQTAEGIKPFLHVALSNERALRLYIHLGFHHRREIVFRRLRKIG